MERKDRARGWDGLAGILVRVYVCMDCLLMSN